MFSRQVAASAPPDSRPDDGGPGCVQPPKISRWCELTAQAVPNELGEPHQRPARRCCRKFSPTYKHSRDAMERLRNARCCEQVSWPTSRARLSRLRSRRRCEPTNRRSGKDATVKLHFAVVVGTPVTDWKNIFCFEGEEHGMLATSWHQNQLAVCEHILETSVNHERDQACAASTAGTPWSSCVPHVAVNARSPPARRKCVKFSSTYRR